MPDAASLPPRSALPRDVDIPVLPGVGITWYDRSGRYWARRVALTLMWAVVLLLIVLIDVGIFTAIHHSSPGTAAVLLTIDVLVAIAVLCYFAIHTVRRWNTPALPGRVRTASWRRGPRPRWPGWSSWPRTQRRCRAWLHRRRGQAGITPSQGCGPHPKTVMPT